MRSSEPLVLMRRAGSPLGRRPLEEFARRLQQRVAGGRAFCCLIAGDRALARLNRRFLGKDYPTDVLSFPAAEFRGARTPDPPALGEIAISLDRARAQARRFGHSLDAEVRILMLHGVLHLVGMDHERDTGAMARAESRWRRRLGLPAGLIERVPA
jgi:probable rRNA maturation factor